MTGKVFLGDPVPALLLVQKRLIGLGGTGGRSRCVSTQSSDRVSPNSVLKPVDLAADEFELILIVRF